MDNQIKKTVRLNGHTTSLALEKEFWKELNIIASNQSLSLNELVEKIDTLERKGGFTIDEFNSFPKIEVKFLLSSINPHRQSWRLQFFVEPPFLLQRVASF